MSDAQPPARSVACPTCGAEPGERCEIAGTELNGIHAARTLALTRAAEQVIEDSEFGYGSS